MIKLNANESPFGRFEWGTFLNRYPDPSARDLKNAYGAYAKVSPDALVCGNGSDELIDMLFALYGLGETVVTMNPDFSMYDVYAKKYKADLKSTNQFEAKSLLLLAKDFKAPMMVFSNPNNPTGRIMPVDEIEKILEAYDGVLVVDEAYIEFSNGSCVTLMEKYPKLVVTRTCSKALGLAGLRVGFAICSKEIKDSLESIRSPYNVGVLPQILAAAALGESNRIQTEVQAIVSNRRLLLQGLKTFFHEEEVYEGNGNFVYISTLEARALCEYLASKEIFVRDFEGAIRITVGNAKEVLQLLDAIEQWRENNANSILQTTNKRNAG